MSGCCSQRIRSCGGLSHLRAWSSARASRWDRSCGWWRGRRMNRRRSIRSSTSSGNSIASKRCSASGRTAATSSASTRLPASRRSPVSRDTIEVLDAGRTRPACWTGGKFDITFGALADIWKFDHDQDNVVPDRAAIEKRLPLVNFEEVQTDRAAGHRVHSQAGHARASRRHRQGLRGRSRGRAAQAARLHATS